MMFALQRPEYDRMIEYSIDQTEKTNYFAQQLSRSRRNLAASRRTKEEAYLKLERELQGLHDSFIRTLASYEQDQEQDQSAVQTAVKDAFNRDGVHEAVSTAEPSFVSQNNTQRSVPTETWEWEEISVDDSPDMRETATGITATRNDRLRSASTDAPRPTIPAVQNLPGSTRDRLSKMPNEPQKVGMNLGDRRTVAQVIQDRDEELRVLRGLKAKEFNKWFTRRQVLPTKPQSRPFSASSQQSNTPTANPPTRPFSAPSLPILSSNRPELIPSSAKKRTRSATLLADGNADGPSISTPATKKRAVAPSSKESANDRTRIESNGTQSVQTTRAVSRGNNLPDRTPCG